MKKYLTLLLIILLSANFGYGQLTLNMQGEWPKDVTARVLAYHGLSVDLLDRSTPGPDVFSFEVPDSIKAAMFVLQIADTINVIYETQLVYDGNKLEMTLTLKDQSIAANYSASAINGIYQEFIAQRDLMLKRLRILKNLYAYYPDANSGFYKSLDSTVNEQLVDLSKLFEQSLSEQKNTVLDPFISSGWIYIPSSKADTRKQIDEMLSHFYDHFDPLNKTILNSPVYQNKLDEYLELILQAAPMSDKEDEQFIMDALDDYFPRVMEDQQVFEQSLEYIWDYMHRHGMESVTEYLDVNYLAGSCLADNDEQLKERLLAYERLALGSPAPEINWVEHDMQRSLNDFKGGYTLIVFWASWCPHCTSTLSGVHEYTLGNENLHVLAIGLDEDANAWNAATLRYPGWTHIRAAEKWDSPIAHDYAIYATPTFYILDVEGNILGKAKNLHEIEQLIPSE